MLKKVRLVVLGGLMAGLLCYACIGMNAAPVLACSGSGGDHDHAAASTSAPACGGAEGKKMGAPCDISKELGLTPEQQTKFNALKAECEKNGDKCTPECFQKVKALLTEEQSKKLESIIVKMKGGCAGPQAK